MRRCVESQLRLVQERTHRGTKRETKRKTEGQREERGGYYSETTTPSPKGGTGLFLFLYKSILGSGDARYEGGLCIKSQSL